MSLLTILGASGRTGTHAVKFALARGYGVTALARAPERITVQHEHLTVVRGDAADAEAIERATPPGTNAILSALGHSADASSTILEDGTRNALSVMQARRIRRLIVLGASGMHVDRYDGILLGLAKRLIVQRVFAETYADARRMEGLVRAGDVDWTILVAPRLVDETAITPYRAALDHNVPRALQLSRINFADAMLNVLNDETTFAHFVFVGR